MEGEKLLPCKCGKSARIRYNTPTVWVECSKKCGMMTHYYFDYTEQCDRESRKLAIDEWNRMVKKYSQGK